MKPGDGVRHTVRNDQEQPIELHLPGGVLVLLPGETAELSEADLAVPQLQVLCQSRRITRSDLTATRSALVSDDANAETTESPRSENVRARRRGAPRNRM